MANRSVLFGYYIIKGRKKLNENESEVVKEIFLKYNSGATFKVIAEYLTEKHIVYFQDNSTWNKNMVSRIVGDIRYTGTEDYPELISQTLYNECNEKRRSKCSEKAQLSDLLVSVKAKMKCGSCGHSFSRKDKWRTREKWYCPCGCKTDIYLDDKVVTDEIIQSINCISELPELDDNAEYKPSNEVTMEINEIQRLMEKSDIDSLVVSDLIMKNATKRFDCCYLRQNTKIREKLIQAFSGGTESIAQMINQAVKSIIVQKNGNLKLKLVGGFEVESHH